MAWSGDMLLEAADSSLPVAANQRVEVWQEGPQGTTHYRRVAIPSDDFASWALAQDKLDDRAHAAAHGASAPVPEEMTGSEDLSQYGTWAQSGDYGQVWYPSGVPAGWAPYTDGVWSWSVGWGWTWIDYAPWGFAPFHYGRWAWVGGRWGWCPGYWGPRPIYAPALVGWVGGAGFWYGGYPWVGWVPLAPYEPYYPPYAISVVYWNGVNGGHAPPPIHRPPYPGDPRGSRPRSVPSGPVNYANRNVPGAVSMAPAQSLTQRQPTPVQRTPGTARMVSEVVAGMAQMLQAPAAPQGRAAPGVGSVARAGRPGSPAAPAVAADPGGGPTAPGAAAAPNAPNAPNAPAAAPAPAARGGPSGRSPRFVVDPRRPVMVAGGPPAARMGAFGPAPSAFNAPPSQFNAPPSQFNAPPTPFNAPPTQFNAPPSSLNAQQGSSDDPRGQSSGPRPMPMPMGQPPAPAFGGNGGAFGGGFGGGFFGPRGGHQ
jgi:hypothetical protein